MGGLAVVTLGASYGDRIDAITKQIEDLFTRLEKELSTYRFDSVITQLEEQASVAPVRVSDDALRVLTLGKQFGDLSGGSFDITIPPVLRLWGFGPDKEPTTVPSEGEIQDRLKLVDYRRLELADHTAYLPMKGMAVDLGGIAKGFAVDRAFELCRKAGIEDFLLDLSGNLRASGKPRWRGAWQIGVRDPYDRSHILGKVNVREGWALATSGSYERFVLLGDTRYSHVMDARTGQPVKGTASVTILAPDAATADGLSTPFFIAGLDGAGALLAKVPRAEVMIVPDTYPTEIWLTPGFADAFLPAPQFAEAIRLITPRCATRTQ